MIHDITKDRGSTSIMKHSVIFLTFFASLSFSCGGNINNNELVTCTRKSSNGEKTLVSSWSCIDPRINRNDIFNLVEVLSNFDDDMISFQILPIKSSLTMPSTTDFLGKRNDDEKEMIANPLILKENETKMSKVTKYLRKPMNIERSFTSLLK